MQSVKDIRRTFLDYFQSKNHKIVESSPLVPQDPTLLFTNSGMVQFKNIFTGISTPSYNRATTAQKCVRAGGKHNDLDNVGYTARHHTFFEMLGNFSFGDYFKEDAIYFAWDFLTKELALPKNKLLVTIYHEDDEALTLWKKIANLPDEKIIRIATKDNFWMMGDTGPCGPCSEIFYDHGDSIAGGPPGSPEEDGDRFVEIWNLVFMQYEMLSSGDRIVLPKPSIDTGMGLERFATIMQNKHNNYDIDLFQNIINDISKKASISPNEKNIQHFRVIADHLRSSCFLIADGVIPSNEGRGYVLRRIMRRAMRHAHTMGVEKNLMPLLVDSLINEMGETYLELVRSASLIKTTLDSEETQFRKTLSTGLELLEKQTANLKQGSVLNGEIAFKLYDTYGFSLDLTQDIMKARGITVDEDAFNKAMDVQRSTSRQSWVGSSDSKENPVWFSYTNEIKPTIFNGYKLLNDESVVLKILNEEFKEIPTLKEGKAFVILENTPFYAESGGQVADTGFIKSKNANLEVLDVQKRADSTFFVHTVNIIDGSLAVGDRVQLLVNKENRIKTMAHHSAAHLLQYALRKVLGEHVLQRGSLVKSDYMRFDFSHPKQMDKQEIQQVEKIINEEILENHEIVVAEMTKDEAVSKGAMALFGEKYGAIVRTIKIGDSFELCGGTHAKRSGDLGLFKIISEESIASGVRRIEAKVGLSALNHIWQNEQILDEAAKLFTSPPNKIPAKILSLTEELKNSKKQLAQIQTAAKQNKMKVDSKTIKDTQLITAILEDFDSREMKNVSDDLLKKHGEKAVVCLFNLLDDKVMLIVQAGAGSNQNALNLIKATFNYIDGKGGGNAYMAQAGGSNKLGIEKAVQSIVELI